MTYREFKYRRDSLRRHFKLQHAILRTSREENSKEGLLRLTNIEGKISALENEQPEHAEKWRARMYD